MASNQELFGDDDSSSDDEPAKAPDADAPKAAAAADTEDGDSETVPKESENPSVDDPMEVDEKEDDKEDDEKAKADEKPAEKTAKKSSVGGLLQDMSDDDDDDEPQFDGTDGIVGLKSSTIAGSKSRESSAATHGDGGDASPTNVTADVARDTRTMVVPKVDKIRPTDDIHLHMTKLPNILGVQTEAFDPDTYIAAQEEEEFGQAAYNLMRWRYAKNKSNDDDDDGTLQRDADGGLVRESNTRLVEWEDGSHTLHIGNETFAVDAQNSASAATGFAGLNGYLYLSQSAAYNNKKVGDGDDEDDDDDDDDPEPAGTVLECMGPIRSRFGVRPSSLQSEAHKSLTVGIRQKTIKKARIAEFVTQHDPEKMKEEKIRHKADLEKAAMRKRGGAGGPSSYNRSAPRPRMSRSYLEEDDRNFDTTDLRGMKRRTMNDDYDEDDDDDDFGVSDQEDTTFNKGGRARKAANKTKAEEDSDQEETFMVGDDDDDDVAPVIKASGKKRSHQAVFDDDSD